MTSVNIFHAVIYFRSSTVHISPPFVDSVQQFSFQDHNDQMFSLPTKICPKKGVHQQQAFCTKELSHHVAKHCGKSIFLALTSNVLALL